MLGAIIGDVVGSVYEFNNIRTTEFQFYDHESFFTDDTVCTVALMDWLLHANRKDDKSATEFLHKWTRKYPNAGYGGRFRAWVRSSDPKPYGSYGNGAAMRISPVAWASKNNKQAIELTDIATRITHNHPEGMKGAETVTQCIRMALDGADKRKIWNYVISVYPDIADFEYEMLRQLYEFNETCQESVPQAIYCFLISTSYEDCIRKTISIGGDSDTLAAISGAIAEAFWGIPEYMVNRFREKLDREMLEVIEDFYRKYVNNRESPKLKRFLDAQEPVYKTVIKELEAGKKETHWMWYIFPQIKGLGKSETSEYYGLDGLREAALYYNHPILGNRLSECAQILYELEDSDIKKVLGFPDYKKLKSCMTLFYLISRDREFKQVLNKYFDGELDHETMLLTINMNIRK